MNGKVCGVLKVVKDVSCDVIEVVVVVDEVFVKFSDGKLVKKIVVVLGCFVNIVV